MTFLGKFDKMAMGPFGAGVTEIDELLYETFFSASPRNRSRVNDPELDRMLRASGASSTDETPRDRAGHPALPRRQGLLCLPADVARYITYPSYVKASATRTAPASAAG